MSTKVTMLLTDANEHWYKEGSGPSNEGSKTQAPLILEFDSCHKVETSSGGTRIVIEEDTPLYTHLSELFKRLSQLPDAGDIRTRILEFAIQALSDAFNELVGACLDPNGNPKAPEYKALMKARGFLPPSCEHALSKKREDATM